MVHILPIFFTDAIGTAFYDEEKLKIAEDVVKNLKNAYKSMINENKFGDDETGKNKMLKKVRMIPI